MSHQHLQHKLGDSLFLEPSAFDKWMEKEGNKIIEDISKSSKRKCYICGTRNKITEHHMIPLYFGGIDFISNIVYICEKHHKEIHSKNIKNNDREWISIIKKMKDRNIYKARSNINNKEDTK